MKVFGGIVFGLGVVMFILGTNKGGAELLTVSGITTYLAAEIIEMRSLRPKFKANKRSTEGKSGISLWFVEKVDKL